MFDDFSNEPVTFTDGEDLEVEVKKKTNKGIEYENKVKSIVRTTSRNIKGFSLSVKEGGGNDNKLADLYINVNRQRYGVEIKLDSRAPLGQAAKIKFDGSQFIIDKSGDFSVDDALGSALLQALSVKKQAAKAYIDFIKNSPPKEYHSKVKGFPFMCIIDTWNAAKDKGLLKTLNATLKVPIDVVFDYYASKDVYYIQIGGAGLFYMKKNPLNLDIQQLSGSVNIEMRLKSAGRKPRAGLGITICTGSISASPRLATKNISRYSLDVKDDLIKLFSPPTED
jgi:hypothetical protein